MDPENRPFDLTFYRRFFRYRRRLSLQKLLMPPSSLTP